MSLQLLVNSVFANTAQLKVTDTSNADTTDQAGIYTITGASRQLAWTSNATADRRLVYINKAGTLSCTHVVLTRADKHLNHTLNIHSFETYSSSATLQYNSGAAFADTLIGPLGQDWVRAQTMTSKQGLSLSFLAGTGGNYTKVVHSLYFCTAFALNYPGPVTAKPQRLGERHQVKHNSFLIDERRIYTAENLTKAEITQFEQLYKLKENPVFLYDADGTVIPDKLAHGMIGDYVISKQFNDLLTIEFAFSTLRQWS